MHYCHLHFEKRDRMKKKTNNYISFNEKSSCKIRSIDDGKYFVDGLMIGIALDFILQQTCQNDPIIFLHNNFDSKIL